MGNIISVQGKTPKIGKNVFIAENARVIGDVEIGDESSIWFNCTIRGDVHKLVIGKKVNIQDGTILHGMYEKYGVTLEDGVSVGHGVILHGCHIGENTLVGMGSIVMDNAKVGKNSIIAAGSLVPEGKEIPGEVVAMGRPAKPVRPLNDREKELLKYTTNNYLMYKTWFEGGPA